MKPATLAAMGLLLLGGCAVPLQPGDDADTVRQKLGVPAATTCSPNSGCGMPSTAASATSGWACSTSSTSRG